MSDDLIRRSDAIKAVNKAKAEGMVECPTYYIGLVPSADRPQGEWEEKTKFHIADDDPIIEEWQCARCSVCGKYHTTPYLYYFDNFNFCPHCGAMMFAEDTNVPNKKGADDE